MEHHTTPSMAKVVFLLMGFLHPFAGQVFVCSTPLGFPHHLACLPRTHTHIYVCNFNQHFVCAPMPYLGNQTKSTFEKGDFIGL